MAADSTYEFGADGESEGQRLAGVEHAFDRVSRWALLHAGVVSGWRCWEAGAGNGSIATWLASAVGPDGGVLATDLDDQRFEGGPANLEFLKHDVVADRLPGHGFDLIHARFLLEHLPDPRLVIDRFRDAVRPGGIVVLEDSAGLELEVTPSSPLFDRLVAAWEPAGRAVGWDASYGRRLISDMQDAGLIDLSGHQYRQLHPGGADWIHLTAGLERLADELVKRGIAPAELERVARCLTDPGSLITGPPVIVVWGRR